LPAGAPNVGEQFTHYKGDSYKVVGLALHSNNDWHVVYEPLYEGAASKLFSRPVAEWHQLVDWEGQQVQRFVKN
jgi:hypothetical protein